MKHFSSIILLFLLIACGTTMPNTNYWEQQPNLSKITFEGGDGKSVDTAIKIKNAKNELDGVSAEYKYIANKYGEKFTAWKPLSQATLNEKNKIYDALKIQLLPSEEIIVLYFDITDFYGKF